MGGGGNAYVTKVTNSLNFPVSDGAVQKTFGGAQVQNDFLVGDAFVLKLSAAGTNAIYSTYLGGRQNEVALGLAVDGQGNAYVTGSTNSRDFPTTAGAYQTEFKGAGGEQQNIADDVFVTKLNAGDSGFVYSTYFGRAGMSGRRRTGCRGCIWSSQRRTCPDGRCVCDAVGCRGADAAGVGG